MDPRLYFSPPSEELMAQRLPVMLEVLARMHQDIYIPVEAVKPNRKGVRPLVAAHPVKSALDRLNHGILKLLEILADLDAAKTAEEFEHKRQYFYTQRSWVNRFAKANGLDKPQIPAAPVSTWPGARPCALRRLRAQEAS